MISLQRTKGILLSCEVPTNFLPTFDKYLDYHFCLAHLVLENEGYRKFYQTSQKYKILDNSAFELGVPISNTKLLEAAKLINPQEIVCRDSLGNGAMTIQRTAETLEFFEKRNYNVKFMGVLQATNLKDFTQCVRWMQNHPRITILGLNGWPTSINAFKDSVGTEDPTQCRLAALRYLYTKDFADKPVHLLGMGNNPIELKAANKYKFVRSCDTSSPVVHGIYGVKFDPNLGLLGPKIKEKLNFNLSNLNEIQVKAILSNIRYIHTWCK